LSVAMKSVKVGDLEQTHAIIQCPQCQTKFAVDRTSIQHLESPRFHCSRCDSVFAFDTRPATPRHSIAEPAEPIATGKSKLNPEFQSQPEVSASQTDQAQEEESFQDSLPTNMGKDWELPRSLAISSSQSPAAPQLNNLSSATQMGFNFGETSVGNAAIQSQPRYEDPDLKRFEATAFPFDAIPAPKAGLSRWTSFAYLAAPLLFFVSGVLGMSAYLNQNAERGEDMILSLSPSLPQVPPAEVSIEQTGFRRAVLDSGEVVYLVSGTLVNSSDKTFKEIQLEGLGFDARGSLISRTKVDAAATLAKTRVRSLSPSMIQELQSGRVKSKQEIKPGQSQEFTFALLDGKPELAKFFSARVYSVSVQQ
jgi:predicted Zn finger-like uncharacterized protein